MAKKYIKIKALLEHAKTLKRLGGIKRHDEYVFLIELTSFLPPNSSVSQRLWHIDHNIFIIPKCVVCDDNTVWNKHKGGSYRECCSNKCATKNPNRIKKIQETNMARRGVKSPFGCKKIRDEIKQTIKDKYDVDNISQIPAVKEKKKQTSLKNHGVDHPLQSEIIRNKVEQTILKNHGVKNSFQVPAVKEKIKQHWLDKKGVEYVNQNHEAMQCLNDKKWLEEQHLVLKKTMGQIGLDINTHEETVAKYIHLHNIPVTTYPSSMAEREINTWINELGIKTITNVRNIIGLELDIYIPEFNLAIEYNGLYYHSAKQGKEINYHLNKTTLCEEKNIRLIHIFEDEWRDHKQKCKDTIRHFLGKSEKGVYARKTVIKEIPWKQAKSFLNEYHLLGAGTSGNKRIGAFDNDTNLIGVMVFGQSNNEFNKSKTELKRFVTDKKNNPGLGSKMFKYAVNEFDYIEIIAYVDKRWFTGLVKNYIGFTVVSQTKPALFWTDYKNRYNRRFMSKKELSETHNTTTLTKQKMMEMSGFDTIYDCGKIKLLWKK